MAVMPVIDADAHVNEDLNAWTTLNERRPGWLGAGKSGGKWVAQIDGKLYPTQDGPGCGVPIDSAVNPSAEAGARDVDKRLADMDAEGIDVQVLFGGLAIGVTTFSDPGFALDFAQAYNGWLLSDVCGVNAARLKGVGIVPLQDVDRAVSELERVVKAGAVAVTIPPYLGERNLDDPTLLPFFEAASAAGTAVAVHGAPGMNLPMPAAGRFTNYAAVHCLSFPVDQMVAFTALAMGGVFDRLPDLRVVFLESGIGWVPYYVDRMNEHHEKRGDMVPQMTSDPRDIVARGQCFFSFECEDTMLESYVDHLGADSLVFSSDYPHWDSEFPGTVEEARRRGASLGDDALDKLLGANAARLYRLDVA